MPTLKAIRRRISSVKNTQQITKAMKMVAAAKLRRSQEAVENARPYAEKMVALLKNLSARTSEQTHPLLMNREENRIELILLTSDRGLCGGYNANLIRSAENFLRSHTPQSEVTLTMVGRKGADYFRRRDARIGDRYVNIGSRPLDDLAGEVAGKTIQRFRREESDSTYLIYSRFQSALSQVPTVQKLIPVEKDEQTDEAPAIDYLFEPSDRAVLSSLLPKVVEITIFRALLEAAASENGARMTAMESATSNATDMINVLTLQMNRARQASITRELLEVVSTAEALK